METACFSDSRTGTLVPLGTSGSGVGNIPSATEHAAFYFTYVNFHSGRGTHGEMAR